MASVATAFRQARIHAYRHMVMCERAHLRWGETTITEIVMAQAARAVTVVPFQQNAEARSGADWVWWWVDPHGTYGMLVQAKRVTITPRRWRFDFGYRNKHSGETQQSMLRKTAAELGLLPVYALYLGTGHYRGWHYCSPSHSTGRCLGCVKRTISLMPALLANTDWVNDARSTYERSVALEESCKPTVSSPPLIPTLTRQLAPELKDFLTTRQDGTRAVARRMLDLVLDIRARQYRMGASTPIHSSPFANQQQPLFSSVPDDTGHWQQPYFEHLLDPLRGAPPSYVTDITEGRLDPTQIASEMPRRVAGVVVIELSEPDRD